MSANCTDRRTARGFTLLELVLIIVLLGILAVVALPRFNQGNVSAGLFRDEVAGALRYAQKSATARRRMVCASIGANSLSLAVAATPGASACGSALPLPGGASALESGDASAAISPAPLILYFQPDGRISPDAAGGGSYAATLSVGGLPVTIVGGTGHVR